MERCLCPREHSGFYDGAAASDNTARRSNPAPFKG
jgi:hypothetical protein